MKTGNDEQVLIPAGMVATGGGLTGTQAGEYVGTGWVNDQDAVLAVLDDWARRGRPVTLSQAAPALITGDDDAPVFFWLNELAILGRRLDTWNQKGVGSCVGFGSTRAAQDLLLAEIAGGEPEQWPGAEGCPEVTYGGSRVEVGGGQIRGDGSVGVWASEFFTRFGYLTRGIYGNLNLTQYDESTCRRLGSGGLPPELETLAKAHPVRTSALTRTGAEGWAAIGGFKPISVCSNRGFAMRRNADGTCDPSGVWNHCMGVRGRFVEPRQKRKRFVLGNSWADYLGSSGNQVEYIAADGSVKTIELPPGHFATEFEVIHDMLRQQDSFAYAGLTGWAKTVVDYTP